MSKTAAVRRRVCAAAAGVLALAAGGSAVAGSITYQYDALGRLISSTNSDGVQTTYSYDPAGNRTSQTVNVTLPIAEPGSFSLNENSGLTVLPITILGAPATSVAISSNAAFGGLQISGTSIAYIPSPGFAGADSFSYTASNANGSSEPATFALTVNTLAPVAASFSRTVAANSSNNPFDIGFLLTGGTPTTVTIASGASQGVTSPVNGSTSSYNPNAGFSIYYTPATGYIGSGSLQYTVTNNAGSSTGTITIAVVASITSWDQFNWDAASWADQ